MTTYTELLAAAEETELVTAAEWYDAIVGPRRFYIHLDVGLDSFNVEVDRSTMKNVWAHVTGGIYDNDASIYDVIITEDSIVV